MARQFYDYGMAELFRHPDFINSLLTEIVAEEWVKLIDFDSLQLEDGVYKEIGEVAKYNDIVASFRCKAGSSCEGFSIYLLIEPQRSQEPMSLRLLEYLSRVYRRQKVTGKSRYGTLHPVVPIIIYNGVKPWLEDPSFISRFPGLPPALRPYIPSFRYYLLDEGQFDKKLLSRLKGAAAAFIKIDTIAEPEKTKESARIIIDTLGELWKEHREASKLLAKYADALLAHKGIENPGVTDYIINRRRSPMFAESLDRAMKNKWREGKKEGKQEGIAVGVRQGSIQDKQAVLIRQLSRKFEVLPQDQVLISSCQDPEKLDAALDVILFAPSKELVVKELE